MLSFILMLQPLHQADCVLTMQYATRGSSSFSLSGWMLILALTAFRDQMGRLSNIYGQNIWFEIRYMSAERCVTCPRLQRKSIFCQRRTETGVCDHLATQVQRRTVIISFVGKELHRFWMRSMQVLEFLNEINLLPQHACCVLVKVEMLCQQETSKMLYHSTLGNKDLLVHN